MKLVYAYDKEVIELTETPKEKDVEFDIRLLGEEAWQRMKEVKRLFEDNDVYTDVLFYPFENRRMQAIVRRDYYEDFILELLKQRLLVKAEWA